MRLPTRRQVIGHVFAVEDVSSGAFVSYVTCRGHGDAAVIDERLLADARNCASTPVAFHTQASAGNEENVLLGYFSLSLSFRARRGGTGSCRSTRTRPLCTRGSSPSGPPEPRKKEGKNTFFSHAVATKSPAWRIPAHHLRLNAPYTHAQSR